MRVAVLCRGSVAVGLGHISRAASLALALGDRLSEFVVIGDETGGRFAKDYLPSAVLASSDGSAVEHLDDRNDLIVLDMTTIERAWFEKLQERAQLVSISPVFEFQREVARSYGRTVAEPDPVLAADPIRHRRGPQYAVLGPHARRVSSEDYVSAAYESPLSVGIAMGGSDAANMTMRAVRALGEVDTPLIVWAMLGEGYGHSYDQLVAAISENGRHEALLAKSGRSMWTVLSRTALVVLAGGVTSYEAAFAGIPAINVSAASNSYLVDELAGAGAAITLSEDAGWRQMPSVVMRLDADRDELFSMHRRAVSFIDDLGAQRIVDDLVELVDSEGH